MGNERRRGALRMFMRKNGAKVHKQHSGGEELLIKKPKKKKN